MSAHSGIEPDRLYSFAEAARLVPSVYRGKHVTVTTLHRWRREGKLQAQEHTHKGKPCYLVRGNELLRAIAERKDRIP